MRTPALTFPLFGALACTLLVLNASADEDLATSEPTAFKLCTTMPIGIATQAEKEAFGAYPLTFLAGETITATAPDGTSQTIKDNADADGSQSFIPTTGGIWTLTNSGRGSVAVVVGWDVYDDGWTLNPSVEAAFKLDTYDNGPDRKLKKREVPPIAYSGDDWAGDLSKAATITFTPPEGYGLEATTWDDLSGGNGARAFTFNARGVWTVALTFADNTTRTAHINIQTAGFMLIVK